MKFLRMFFLISLFIGQNALAMQVIGASKLSAMWPRVSSSREMSFHCHPQFKNYSRAKAQDPYRVALKNYNAAMTKRKLYEKRQAECARMRVGMKPCTGDERCAKALALAWEQERKARSTWFQRWNEGVGMCEIEF